MNFMELEVLLSMEKNCFHFVLWFLDSTAIYIRMQFKKDKSDADIKDRSGMVIIWTYIDAENPLS